jgi:hypothetical protein
LENGASRYEESNAITNPSSDGFGRYYVTKALEAAELILVAEQAGRIVGFGVGALRDRRPKDAYGVARSTMARWAHCTWSCRAESGHRDRARGGIRALVP